jgi:hypothetical protein
LPRKTETPQIGQVIEDFAEVPAADFRTRRSGPDLGFTHKRKQQDENRGGARAAENVGR